VGPNCQSVTSFDYHAAVCLTDSLGMFVKSRSVYSLGWSGAELSIDTAVNEWRKRLLACVHIMGQHFKQFYCRQLKNEQLDELSAKMSEI